MGKWQRLGVMLSTVVLVVVGITGCSRASSGDSSQDLWSVTSTPTPTTVKCGDAAGIKQLARAEFNKSERESSYNPRLPERARANYLRTLGLVAELTCKVSSATVAAGLKSMFAAAHQAEHPDTPDFREATADWEAADFQAKAVLEQQLQLLWPSK
jgi:hypothetical protein